MLPETLKIGATTWKVVTGPLDDWGLCDIATRTITISDVVKDEGLREQLLIHEVLHACCDFVGIDGKLTEEEFVTRLAPILHSTLRQNEAALGM